MTREELLDSVKHLKWARGVKYGRTLRCERGDCPVLAALRLKYPSNPLFVLGATARNKRFHDAAMTLGLDRRVAMHIASAADCYWKSIPELEGARK